MIAARREPPRHTIDEPIEENVYPVVSSIYCPISRLERLEEYQWQSEEDRFYEKELRINRQQYRSHCIEQMKRDRQSEMPYTNYYYESNIIPERKYQRRL